MLRVISLFSLFSQFADPTNLPVLLANIMPLMVSFGAVLAFHPMTLFPRASIPVVPTGHCRGWRVALPPRPPKGQSHETGKP